MKVYFSAAISGGREIEHLYPPIVNILQELGHEVLTAVFAAPGYSDDGHSELTDEQVFTRDLELIHRSNVVVAEITQPSTGVGVEIEAAWNIGRPVIALFNTQIPGKSLSAMVAGSKNNTVIKYQDSADLEPQLSEALASIEAKQTQSVIA